MNRIVATKGTPCGQKRLDKKETDVRRKKQIAYLSCLAQFRSCPISQLEIYAAQRSPPTSLHACKKNVPLVHFESSDNSFNSNLPCNSGVIF